MKCKAIILDKNHNVSRELIGDYDKGSFKYNRSGIPILKWVLGKNEFAANIIKSIKDSKRIDTMFFLDDGVNYHQIDLFTSGSEEKMNINAYLDTVEKGILAKDLSLEKPGDLKELINFMVLIALILAIIGMWLTSQDNYNHALNLLKPFNQSIQNQAHQFQQLANLTLQSIRVNNATLTYFRQHSP